MPGDMLSNIDEYNFVLSSIHALQQLYLPDHVIYGGEWNADFSALVLSIQLHFLSLVLTNI